MSQFFASFDNRELAVVFWLIIMLVAAATSGKVRASMVGVVRAFYVRPILIGLLLLAAYFSGLVVLLAKLGVWGPAQLKLTLLWFFTVGAVGLFSAQAISENPCRLSQSVRSNLKITVLLEFFVNLYRMPLLAELVFVPFTAVLGALLAVSETKDEFIPARRLFNGVAIFVGSLLLAYAVWNAVTDFKSLANADAVRSFVLPVVYSLLLLPFLWLAAVFIAYEEVFVRLQFVAKDQSLHPYIRKSLLLKFRGNIRLLRIWFQVAWFRSFATKSDVDESIQTLLDGVCTV